MSQAPQRKRPPQAPESVQESPGLEVPPVPSPAGLEAWLVARGVRAAPEKLARMLAAAVGELPAEVRIDGREELSGPELASLEEGGLDPAPRTGGADPVAQGVIEYAALLQTSLDVNEAAERAGVVPARIRQRLNSAPRTLVGVRVDNVWRVPLFQFREQADEPQDGLVPEIGEVVKEIDPGAHVLAIQRWFLGEHVDLPADEEEARLLCPRDWLLLGRDPQRIAELAREL